MANEVKETNNERKLREYTERLSASKLKQQLERTVNEKKSGKPFDPKHLKMLDQRYVDLNKITKDKTGLKV